MSIKDKPIGLREYYENAKDIYTKKKEVAQLDNDRLEEVITRQRNDIVKYLDLYKLPIVDYPEFRENKYINGRLLNAAIGLYQDKRIGTEVKGACFKLLVLAKNQEKYYNNIKIINKANKVLSLSYKQYIAIIRTFYKEVHKKLILDGYGYVFHGTIGWVCINRVLNTDRCRKMLDFAATNAKKKEFKAKGIRLYNKEEAEWCKQNNIPYDGVDYKVYKKDECWYQFCLIGSTCKNALSLSFTPADSRPTKYHGVTNDDFIKLCNNNKDKILNLDLDIKTKLTLCLTVDKILYTKFIRNENQTTNKVRPTYRKS